MSESPPSQSSPPHGRSPVALRLEIESLQAFGISELLLSPRAKPAAVEVAAPPLSANSTPAPPPVLGDPGLALAAIAQKIAACRQCGLAETRTKVVPGQGNPRPRLALLGEAPGANEDTSGLAFVGAAGQLLTKMLAAMGLAREEVFILNVLKCRPPGNRAPAPAEIQACAPFLADQLRELQPELVVALGGTAAHHLLQNDVSIRRLRGRVHQVGGQACLVTYHPSYLLQNPEMKRDAWEDLKLAMAHLGLAPPGAK